MLLQLLLTCPVNKLVPIPTSVHNAKAVNTVNSFVHHLQRCVSVAHQTLADKIDAVSHMARLDIDVNVLISELRAVVGCIVVDPVALTDIVLKVLVRLYRALMDRDLLPDNVTGGRPRRWPSWEQSAHSQRSRPPKGTFRATHGRCEEMGVVRSSCCIESCTALSSLGVVLRNRSLRKRSRRCRLTF